MSASAKEFVLADQRIRDQTDLLLMLLLAEEAESNGEILNPDWPRFARNTRMVLGRVFNRLEKLKEKGLLESMAGTSGQIAYRIVMDGKEGVQ